MIELIDGVAGMIGWIVLLVGAGSASALLAWWALCAIGFFVFARRHVIMGWEYMSWGRRLRMVRWSIGQGVTNGRTSSRGHTWIPPFTIKEGIHDPVTSYYWNHR